MNDFMTVLKGRRSIRKYEDRPVPDDMLNVVLESVRWSPTWANTQAWEIVVVKDMAVKEKLQAAMAPKNPATKAIVNAPVVLALCGKLGSSGYYFGQVTTKWGDWLMFDLGIAAQTICLAAYDLGLATVIVGLFDHKQAAETLKVPAGYDLAALIPLGFPAKESSPPKHREIAEFTHYDTF